MKAQRSAARRLSTRAQAGISLAGIGALLLAFSMIMLMFVVPTAGADEGGAPFPTGDCGDGYTGGYKIQFADPPSSFSFSQSLGVAQGDIVFSGPYTPGPANFTLVHDYADADSSGYYLDFTYTDNNGYTLGAIFFKTGGGTYDWFEVGVTNPGTLELPKKLSHVTFCFTSSGTTTTSTSTSTTSTTTTVPPTTTSTSTSTTTTTTSTTTTTTVPLTTTTTTVPETTTTTFGGPSTTTTTSSTTTTTVPATTTTVGGPSTTTTTTQGGTTSSTKPDGTTTTIGGPCDPNEPDCLPNTGAGGALMWVMLSGLGLLFFGTGVLMVADERRRAMFA